MVDFMGLRRGIAVALATVGDFNERVTFTATACSREGLAMTKVGWALVTATVVGVGLLSGALGTSAVAPPRPVQSTASAVVATPWTPHIAAVDRALAAGNLTAASTASTQAYRAALASDWPEPARGDDVGIMARVSGWRGRG